MPNKIELQAAMERQLIRFREICAQYAADAEQYAKANASVDRADKKAGEERKLGGGSDTPSKPIVMTAKMEAEAKKTRTMDERKPWENMTTEARKLLKGYVIDDGKALGFGVAHRVEYGKTLEYSNDGKYAILRPTIEHFRAEFLKRAREFFGK